uniref:polysaccharide pyruvyl transferase family protein n=1 Tax=uncultured Brachyspira sp. TaxID=221953 RepID=UPI00259B4512
MNKILNFIFSKKDEGIYRTYRIFGIKIITKPIKLKLDMIESIMFDIKNYTLNKLNNDYTRYCNILSDIILYKDKPKIFYLQTPEHCNIGDLAIAYFSRKFLSDIFPNNIILEYTYNDILGANNLIQKFINSKDIIFLHGGGNLGNLYLNEEILRREIIKYYRKNRIIILPQSIYWTEDEEGEKELEISKRIYSSHNNLTIFARDKKSYKFAKEYFYNNKVFLMPDIVLYKQNINNHTDLIKRKDVIFLLRKDKEKIINDNIINSMKDYINYIGSNYDISDTHLQEDINISISERESYIFNILYKLLNYKLCVTDRFHGVIFSYLTNTPCIVFNSLDHKIEYGVKWFENVEWIYKADINDFNKIKEFINKYLNENNIIEKDIDFNKKIKDIFIEAIGKEIIDNF